MPDSGTSLIALCFKFVGTLVRIRFGIVGVGFDRLFEQASRRELGRQTAWREIFSHAAAG
jgi:hypothetical protein